MEYGPYGYGNEQYPQDRPPKRKYWRRVFAFLLTVAVISFASITIYDALQPQEPEKLPVETQQPPVEASQPSLGSNPILELVEDSGASLSPQEVADKLIPSVVCIQNLTGNIGVSSEGSGIIMTADGYIVTNAHVVSGANRLNVIFSSGESLSAELVGIDAATDLAVIKVNKTGLSPAEFADSDKVEVGEFVMAVGNPGGLEFSSSVTLGIVSAKDRPLELTAGYQMTTIQTDAAINPGNSGGALVNMQGQVVGINSAKYAASGFEGLGFAITTNEATPIINDLIEHGHVKNRAMLGITSVFVETENARFYDMPGGLYVDTVINPNAGDLKSGDMITAVDGIIIENESSVRRILNEKSPGDTVTVTYYRSSTGRTGTTQVVLVEFEG